MQAQQQPKNPYQLAVVSLRSPETGERGYFIGEPMLAMLNNAAPVVALSIDQNMLMVPGDTAIAEIMEKFRKLFPQA